jgi:fatty acid desaturase
VNRHQPGQPPNTMRHTRIVLVVLAVGVVTFSGWLFVWAWQLGSPVLLLFGLVCLPMGLALTYGVVLACERSDVPRVERLLRERRRARRLPGHGWACDTPARYCVTSRPGPQA